MPLLSSEASNFLKNNTGKSIVFTNGCFDIVHIGHIEYLNEAKAQGDLLIVGLNSDKSVKKLKGPERPINNQNNRKKFLENLRSVDFVEIFNDDTPINLIKGLNPNILVKGGDWKINEIVGSEYVLENGGQVKSLKYIEGFSTTTIIDKLYSRPS